MNTPENLLAFRHAALRANLRTIACEFDGSGDSGSINGVGPIRWNAGGTDMSCTHKGLDELMPKLMTCYMTREKNWDFEQNKLVLVPEASLLEQLAKEHNIDLDMVFYSVLDHFPGDWVNEAGGYGTAYLDLATGQYHIDGYQRYESTEAADADGTFFDTPIATANPMDDTADYIKTLLQ